MRGTVIVRGGGDLATGVIYRLWRAGFNILCLEIEHPLVVRGPVSAGYAVFNGTHEVEGMPCVLVGSPGKTPDGTVGVMIDPNGDCIPDVSPWILVDAIMAKRYTGTHREMAPLVLALGPGFQTPSQVHGVIETKRGHYLGRLITKGSAIPNTGIPGEEMGYTVERLLRAPVNGYAEHALSIGDHVEAGDIVTRVDGVEVRSKIRGVLRGLIHPSVLLSRGMKIGDVDPRDEQEHCFTITDKSFAIAGGVLEAVMRFESAGSL
ncbi:MAG: EF2563 family selenium-dependent molybdenum hydroxylase system protein [Synergistaceae bacterium]|nr:EF2563 family selenium-dependent molybdenum hydroxylase system protein [Synergistaceae bacterium]